MSSMVSIESTTLNLELGSLSHVNTAAMRLYVARGAAEARVHLTLPLSVRRYRSQVATPELPGRVFADSTITSTLTIQTSSISTLKSFAFSDLTADRVVLDTLSLATVEELVACSCTATSEFVFQVC